MKDMNRIIIVGNGFDLAHGLKTSYKDFISWYWTDCGDRLLHCHNKIEADGLTSFKIINNFDIIWSNVWGYRYHRNNPLRPWDLNEVVRLAKEDKDLCDFSFTSPLLKRVWDKLLLGWVDIENEYFSLLTEKDQPQIVESFGFDRLNYKELNNQLDVLRNKLIQYLKCESEKTTPIIDDISDIIYRPIEQREISVAYKRLLGENLTGDVAPCATMLLNFNYTKTPEMYLSESSNVVVNYIHGCLENPESVIFGYGDESDDEYKKLQKINDNEYLRHIKTNRYLETPNYRDLLAFIDSAPFQVCIMGHSCGLSDKTLLNTLFEHKNCLSIKPYYYVNEQGKDNYLDIVQNISRNFTNPQLMRDRVVNKTYCEELPQATRKQKEEE